MNINDPFGRMDARQERDYQSLRHALQQAGLSDPRQAAAQLDKIRKRGIIGVCVTIPLTLILMLLIPEARVVFIALGALLVLWIINATRKGQLYLQRYINEELTPARAHDDTPPTP
ncbi:hypothetical protein [Motiliproteus sediminis]|uniref:hypothetical protein n=1 Tax=Motiliproteus sediminis TaxID=1468178 RepID=UPI001AEFD221|nr:hypothetical protein [Motiliproteus sediminis]